MDVLGSFVSCEFCETGDAKQQHLACMATKFNGQASRYHLLLVK